MAQFVKQPQFVSSQPVVFQSQLLQQQPVQVVPNKFQGENDALLKKEDALALNLRKFLFFGPVVFFLVVLVFSSVIYSLRFEKSNSTTPAAAQVLINFGSSLATKPILDIRVLPKYQQDDSTKSQTSCKDFNKFTEVVGETFYDEDTTTQEDSATNELYKEENVFSTFAEVAPGCVCQRQRWGKTLSYHETEYCSENSNCKELSTRLPSRQQKIFLGARVCVRRVNSFKWKKTEEKCEDITGENGKKMRDCGSNLCVSSEKETRFKVNANNDHTRQTNNNCPISELKVIQKPPVEATYLAATGNEKKEIIHFRNRFSQTTVKADQDAQTTTEVKGSLVIVIDRIPNGRPLIGLHASISNPRCLASDLQRPFRLSKQKYNLQQTRESGCWPYGSHVAGEKTLDTVSVTNSYLDKVSQETHFNKDNGVSFAQIPFYASDIVKQNDYVNLYSELRPFVQDDGNYCRSNEANVNEVSIKAKRIILVLDFVEDYSFSFIILSSVGLAISLAFVALRSQNLVNSTTQFYLHLYLFANGVALFVYPIIFWHRVNRYDTNSIEKELHYQSTNLCYQYNGQVEAAKHLLNLIQIINSSIYGLTTFLFVFDVVFFAAVFAAAFLRNKEHLKVCDPVKSESLYYE